MKITVIGAGYVGLVTAACFASAGNDVVCLDIDSKKIELLDRGVIPIHEPGLEKLVNEGLDSKLLTFTTDYEDAINHGVVLFIAVGTPPNEDGSADLQHVMVAAETIGRIITDDCIVVNKSTVPIGTADLVYNRILEELQKRNLQNSVNFCVVSNPEFLKEGSAVEDFTHPDRVVIGCINDYALEVIRELYYPFTDNIIEMDTRSAEFTKYASNAMLATRLALINEFARLADAVGADIEHVRIGIGSDSRIGDKFLYPGPGYGGSCFPKDVTALIKIGKDNDVEQGILKAVTKSNTLQKDYIVKKIVDALGNDLSDYTFAIWGLAFKANTDDMREASSIRVINHLLAMGATVQVYDPEAMNNARAIFGDDIKYCLDADDVQIGADALIILTDWSVFALEALDLDIIFDARNMFDPLYMRQVGYEYYAVGR